MDTAAVRPTAWAGLGAGLVLLLQQTPCFRASAGSRVGAGAGPGSTQLVVGRLAHSDAAGRTFVLDGYRAIQAVEGRSFQEVTDEEMDAVAGDLEATLSDDAGRQGGVLLARDAAGSICGFLWFLDAIETPYGAGSYPPEDEPYTWVHTVFTAPHMRRRGVASRLYRHLETEVRQAGASQTPPPFVPAG